ncbi:hypothetical protein [Enterococcus faecalis]|uniref:hypothetical protein n=1 Tax=Enterococcus faecalis TaxID=1351 RepID=UPI00115D3C74|nr:hypothetical protein [Enterococcus faecalis]
MDEKKDIIKRWFEECERKKISPWKYDFKLELQTKEKESFQEIIDESNAIKRIFVWYLSPVQATSETETTQLAKTIYSILWNLDTSVLNRSFDMDVMNSFWTTYRFAIFKKYNASYNKWQDNIINLSAIYELDKKYYDYIEINNLFETFANYTHTIGNFIIESKGFNMGRKNDDYWDLGLSIIKDNLDVLETGLWKKYVKKFYLQPFVRGDYRVAELWQNHLISEYTKPCAKNNEETIELIKEFLGIVCPSIEERGKFIVKTLCEKLHLTDYTFYKNDLINLTLVPKYSDELRRMKNDESI